MDAKQYFQDFLPGHTCFGCGSNNTHGLGIHSYWDGEIAACEWQPLPYHAGWAGLTCGGIIATLVDCHCIGTAMATAIRNEGRVLGSEPRYLFVTGSLQVKFVKPAENALPLRLEAHVQSVKLDKKYTVQCRVLSQNTLVAEGDVVAILVYRSDRPNEGNPIFVPK